VALNGSDFFNPLPLKVNICWYDADFGALVLGVPDFAGG
jgi:hypothetical protein